MAVRPVLQLGDPRLYEVSVPVAEAEAAALAPLVTDLHDTLLEFRGRMNAGRAIAAPQIGVMKRLIYMHLPDRAVVFVNPELDAWSTDRMHVWDDCLCFPDLLVLVERARGCRITYRDLEGREHRETLRDDLAELLQHEVDHLDGVLAVSRAVGPRAFALRSERARLMPTT
jgi:peptide deformylase